MSDLKPGPKMNAEVAETVMGWLFYAETRGDYTLAVWQRPSEREPWTKYRNPESHKKRYHQITAKEATNLGFFGILPSFSDDDAAACKVLDHVAPAPTHMARLLRNRNTDEWECIIEYDFVGRGKTRAEAICRAALKVPS